ncbi:MAG: VOC family protein [Nitrospirae bacterium]|nr:MAG: VOC family protein [Nitrospirota bacterium]
MEKACPPLQGLRHLALRVRDIRKAKDFYLRIFGMKVVWEPDPQNCYLSSGTDNLALHEMAAQPAEGQASAPASPLDHFGFIAGNPQVVDAWQAWAEQNGVTIVKPVKRHRDGSYSCYLADPDGNTIQILYDPTISKAP